VVLLHGVNLVNKLVPYDPAAIGFDARHAAFLREHGFNTVRLGMIWKALEPEPGRYDDGYLDRIGESVALLGGEGLHVLLDFHQDMLNERFNGEGFPDWAVQDDGIGARPDIGFPGNYFAMRALWRAYDHFWSNDPGPGGVGLQDRYAAAWKHVADRFRDDESVFGYDIFNEPYPGSRAALCAWPAGNRAFDRRLGDFSRRVLSAIREVDRERIVFYEPNVLFDYGADTRHPALGDSSTGFSFHVYCLAASPGLPSISGRAQDLACRRQEQRVFTLAERHARRSGETLLLSEFGATDDTANIGRVADMADANMVSWQYWAYWNRDPSGERPEEGLVHDLAREPGPDNVKWDKLDALARPYPRAVAGTPVHFGFDRRSRRFELSYLTESPAGGRSDPDAETEIYLGRRHYPSGYSATVTGAEHLSDRGAELLRLGAPAGPGQVTVSVTPN
jgi:endoglycosylceramidase